MGPKRSLAHQRVRELRYHHTSLTTYRDKPKGDEKVIPYVRREKISTKPRTSLPPSTQQQQQAPYIDDEDDEVTFKLPCGAATQDPVSTHSHRTIKPPQRLREDFVTFPSAQDISVGHGHSGSSPHATTPKAPHKASSGVRKSGPGDPLLASKRGGTSLSSSKKSQHRDVDEEEDDDNDDDDAYSHSSKERHAAAPAHGRASQPLKHLNTEDDDDAEQSKHRHRSKVARVERAVLGDYDDDEGDSDFIHTPPSRANGRNKRTLALEPAIQVGTTSSRSITAAPLKSTANAVDAVRALC